MPPILMNCQFQKFRNCIRTKDQDEISLLKKLQKKKVFTGEKIRQEKILEKILD